MATISKDVRLKYQATTDGEVETVSFSAGDEVDVVQKWPEAGYVLFKDSDGHYFNIKADLIDA